MSMPRETSPCASVKTLPCSAVIIAASVSRCSFISARKLFSTRARRIGGMSPQAGCAALAAATATATSSAVASSTWRAASPVVGFHTGCARSPVPRTCTPAIQWPTSVVWVKASGAPMAGLLRVGKPTV